MMKKVRKLFAILFTLAMVIGMIGVAPVAQAKAADVNAYLVYTDADWGWSNWNEAIANTTVSGDGTYTVTLTKDALEAAPAEGDTAAVGATVFCVDLVNVVGAGMDPAAMSVSDVKVVADGVEVAVDQAKIACGDIEEKGNFRIEIANAYGLTVDAPAVDNVALTWAESLSVTFTLAGTSAAAAEEPADTEAPAGDMNLSAAIMFADADWGWSNWAFDKANTTVTGDGTYSVTLTKDTIDAAPAEGDNAASGTVVFCVDIEAVTSAGVDPAAVVVSDVKVLADGAEVALDASKIVTGDIEEKGNLRIEIYNEYGTTKENPGIDAAALTWAESLTVEFTLANMVAAATDAPVEGDTAAPAGDMSLNAGLMFADADWGWSNWAFDKANAVVTGDGTYTVTLTKDTIDAAPAEGDNAASGTVVFCVDVEAVTSAGIDPAAVVVSDVKILADGAEVALDASKIVTGDIEEKGNLRIEIYNEYGTTKENPGIDAAALTWAESLSVTFTLTNMVAAEAPAETTPEPTPEPTPALSVDLNGTYHAYLGFQTPVWSFRNAFDDATYGRDTEHFDKVSGWDESNAHIYKSGTFTDAEIAGNGTYTVSVEGLDLTGDFDTQEYFNLIFLSTDIPNSGEITISDMKLSVNGSSVDINPILSPDSPNWVNMLIQNIWNPDVKEIGYYQVPPTKMSITFTVSGFAYDKAAEEVPAEPTKAESSDSAAAATKAPTSAPANADNAETESSSNTGLIIGIIVAVVVVAAIVVMVVISKKKKK